MQVMIKDIADSRRANAHIHAADRAAGVTDTGVTAQGGQNPSAPLSRIMNSRRLLQVVPTAAGDDSLSLGGATPSPTTTSPPMPGAVVFRTPTTVSPLRAIAAEEGGGQQDIVMGTSPMTDSPPVEAYPNSTGGSGSIGIPAHHLQSLHGSLPHGVTADN